MGRWQNGEPEQACPELNLRRRTLRTSQLAGSSDRWLVSYADFVTLLFAFFVVMFATSQVDKQHARAVSEAIKKALNQTSATAGPKDKNDLSSAYEALHKDLTSEVAGGSVRLAMENRGLVISMEAGAFFPSAGADISPDAYPIVGRVASVLQKLPNRIEVEGHTDSRPIRNNLYRSNWELSIARSIAMMRVLNENFGIDTRRMSVVGYGDNKAIDSNETEEGRNRNRRVDIVVAVDPGLTAGPVAR